MRTPVRTFFIFHFSFFIFHFSGGQNLVPNYSFEDTAQCPFTTGQIGRAAPWYSPTQSTPDFFHVCNNGGACGGCVGVPKNAIGFQLPISGSGYAGIGCYSEPPAIKNFRDYIQVQLTDSLSFGRRYCIAFNVSLAKTKYGINRIGAFLSSLPITSSGTDNLPVSAQVNNPSTRMLNDTSNWVKVSDIFQASGGELYITIGNFYDDANTNAILIDSNAADINYYYIDDVSVTLIQAVDAGPSRYLTGCPGDSTAIGPAVEDVATYQWTPTAGLSDPDYYRPTASPTVTTTYYVTKTTPCDTSMDSVTVFLQDCNPPDTTLFIPNTITPNGDGANDTWVIGGLENYPGHWIKIFNRNGNLLWQTGSYDNTWDGTVEGKELPAGVYFYIFIRGDGGEEKGTLAIIR